MADWLETEMTAWRSREQKLEKMFDATVLKSREFLKEKLAHFEVLELRLEGSTGIDERLAMRVIRQQRRELERAVYPGFMLRGLYRLVKLAVDRNRANVYSNRSADSLQQLGTLLAAKGLGETTKQMQKHIAQGQNNFSVNTTLHVNEKERVDFTLEFKPDHDGHIALNDCRARLQREDGSRSGYISLAKNSLEEITAQQAYNLLSGRAVAVGERWLQLDFNDKDAVGNYRTKVFPPSFGFDCEAMLSAIKLKRPDQKPAIVAELRNGNQVEVEQQGKLGKMLVAANAQKKTLLPDQENRAVVTKLANTKVVALNTTEQQQKQVRRQK